MSDNNYQSMDMEKQIIFDLTSLPHLKDHRFQDVVVLPGAVYIEAILATMTATFGSPTWTLTDINFQQPLLLSEHDSHSLNLRWTQANQPDHSVQIFGPEDESTGPNKPQSLYMSGQVSAEIHQVSSVAPKQVDLKDIRDRCGQEISGQDFYSRLHKNGNQYGPTFRAIKQIEKNEIEALADLQMSDVLDSTVGAYQLNTTIIDACVQTLTATHEQQGQPFLWVGVEKLVVQGSLERSRYIYAKRQPKHDQPLDIVIGDIYLVDESGGIMAELSGVRLQYVESKALVPKKTIAVAATFTAEPIEDALNFWCQALEMPFEVAFAPYNQIFQQLLDPASLLSQNKDGVNVLLLRPEDWLGNQDRLALQVSSTEKERLLADHLQYKLSNQIEIAHLNQYETEYLYQEIFEDKVYLKHGITLNDGDCVIDVGANIGLFTLFVLQQCQDPTIYAFEPSTPVFEILQTNAELYGSEVKVFNCGLSNRKSQAPFTYYKHSSVFSSYQADTKADEKAISAIIENVLQNNSDIRAAKRQSLAEDLMIDRMAAETLTCQLTTLSNIIRENHIEQIDLLKIDVERSEVEVLQGIENEHWDIIRQIVIEVHDQRGDVIKEVIALLDAKGFNAVLDEESLLRGSGLYNVYATRRSSRSRDLNKGQPEPISANFEKRQIIDDFVTALKSAVKRSETPHLLFICPATPTAGTTDSDRIAYSQQVEQYLEAELADVSGVHIVIPLEMDTLYPVPDYYNASTDRLGHIPYTPTFFTALGTMTARKIYAWQSLPYKVIVLDCDQTLWQGVCGEDGPSGIELDPARRALQEFMVEQHQSGMLLCLCSKNNEADVMAVFEQRPEMPLSREHITSWRINWKPKSDNIRSLAQELQLGLDAFIFIDDNPVECAEVRANCPEVLTLQLPQEPDRIPSFLAHIWAFDHLKVTEIDRQRAAFYRQDRRRQELQTQWPDMDDFLDRLKLEVHLSEMTIDQLARVSQLTHRTNQFNCTTVRRSEAEIRRLVELDEWECLTVTARDRFGDYGLVGTIIFSVRANDIYVDTFLLSCRALGRGIEHKMLAKLGHITHSQGLDEVIIPYIPTAKNQPAQDFLESVRADFRAEVNRQADYGSDDMILYQFPTNMAKNITLRPRATIKEHTDHVGELSPKLKSNPSTKTKARTSATLIYKIGNELYQADHILDRIEQQKEHQKANGVENYVAPSNELERIVADIWQKVLSVEQAGVNDDFFAMGGTSLKAIQLIALLEQTISKKGMKIDISPINLSDNSTIKDIVNLIEIQ